MNQENILMARLRPCGLRHVRLMEPSMVSVISPAEVPEDDEL